MDVSELCGNLNNWFEVDGLGRSAKISGTFEISGGALDLASFIPEGQYFRIVGSALNDGAHKYGDNDLTDETFKGEVRAMWVPNAVIGLIDDMNDWTAKYGDAVNSPYTSESFGGYSYTKAGAGDGSSGSGDTVTGAMAVFASKLVKWKKV